MEFDFSQNTKVPSLEKVPADFHGLYKQDAEGGYVLDAENPSTKSAVSAVTRLNNALKAARAEAKAGKTDLSPLSEFGQTPEQIAASFKQRLDEAQAAAKASGNEDMSRQLEKIKADLGKQHGNEIQTREKRIEALTNQLYSRMVRAEAISALAEAGVIDPELALPFVEKRVKVSEKDGQFVVTVADDAGDVRYSGTTGAPMSIREFVAEIKGDQKFSPLFRSEQRAGAGTPPGAPNRPTPKPGNREMSATEKIAAGLNKGQYQRGRAAASSKP